MSPRTTAESAGESHFDLKALSASDLGLRFRMCVVWDASLESMISVSANATDFRLAV